MTIKSNKIIFGMVILLILISLVCLGPRQEDSKSEVNADKVTPAKTTHTDAARNLI